jgi:hypothetical protein
LTVYGLDKLKRISEALNLPCWWVESVVIEYFPCRRFGENGRLWTFGFDLLTDEMIKSITSKQVIIPDFFLIHNIRPNDFRERILHGATGNPLAPLDLSDLIPEGMVNRSFFVYGAQSIEQVDLKLEFNEYAIVLDRNIFYQWKIADLTSSGEQNGRYKFDPMNLSKLVPIIDKIREYQNSGVLNSPTLEIIENIARDYEKLEETRNEIRTKILEYHNSKKIGYDISKYEVRPPPRLSIFDSLKVDREKDRYLIKTQIHALFYRSALRSLEKAATAREEGKDAQEEHNALLDEIEYSAICIISSVACLESYINFVIEEYGSKELKKILDKSVNIRQKWFWIPFALELPFRFNEEENPFLMFSELVERRNRAIHYETVFRKAHIHRTTSNYKGSGSYTYSELNLERARNAIQVVRQMVSKLSEGGKVRLPGWLRDWREVRSMSPDLW